MERRILIQLYGSSITLLLAAWWSVHLLPVYFRNKTNAGGLHVLPVCMDIFGIKQTRADYCYTNVLILLQAFEVQQYYASLRHD